MAALSTTVQKVGINGFFNSTSGGLLSMSTATTSVTFTCGALEDVVLFLHNPSGATPTITITASTAEGYASIGRGNLVLSTAFGSSNYAVIANLESNWFQSTSNTFVVTSSTTILIAAIEQSSTRQN